MAIGQMVRWTAAAKARGQNARPTAAVKCRHRRLWTSCDRHRRHL